MAKVVFKKGLSSELPQTIAEGQILLETDTGVIHVDVAANNRLDFSSFKRAVVSGDNYTLTAEIPGIKNQDDAFFWGKLSNTLPLSSETTLSVNGLAAKKIYRYGSWINDDTMSAGQEWIVVYDSTLDSGNGGWNFIVRTSELMDAGTGLNLDGMGNTYNLGQNNVYYLSNNSIPHWYRTVTKAYNSIPNNDYILQGFVQITKIANINGQLDSTIEPEDALVYVSIKQPNSNRVLSMDYKVLYSSLENVQMRAEWSDQTQNIDATADSVCDLSLCLKMSATGTWGVRFINVYPCDNKDVVLSTRVSDDSYQSLYGENWNNYITYTTPVDIIEENNTSSILWEGI